MPYLRVFLPEPTLDQKRLIAAGLTEAVQQALKLPDGSRDWTTVHLLPYRPDDFAVGGKLVADGQTAEYYIDYIDMEVGQPTKDDLARNLTAALGGILGLEAKDYGRINFRYHASSPDNIAMGGHSVRELLER